jgi:arylsulfatase A-like enzyme
VILYVIDGGGADYMSVYGYNRRTTPNLEKLAAEGAVFEHAYSTSSWTKQSTASFMTSLHNSVLGNTSENPVEPLTPQAVTMAEHFHRAGYQTAVFSSNPNAATVSGLERGADVLREIRVQDDPTSSVELHDAFWQWREQAAGQPYWVHFQTTDVHRSESKRQVPPFAGLFVSPEEEKIWRNQLTRLNAADEDGASVYSAAFEKVGISRVGFFTVKQGLHDQQLAHNDYQIGRLVERLKAQGEWQNTLLIVTADHGIRAGNGDDMAFALLDELPELWNNNWDNSPIFRPTISRVPFLVVWPGRIPAGVRFDHPVSLIDLLPTVLGLSGLPQPEVLQGQSLAPVLFGRPGWQPRPVILDEFTRSEPAGELQGRIEIVDGQWGASLSVGLSPARRPRPWPLLLYDLWTDPNCIQPVNQQHPDLVKKYTQFLEDTWKDHQALAKQFEPGAKTALTPEQLERLRALGYIR